MLDSSERAIEKIKLMGVKGNQSQVLRIDNHNGIQSTEYLIINKTQDYHGFSDNNCEVTSEQLSIDLSELNYRILRAKKQGDELKNQNIQLRLEKQNLLTKTTKNGTFKLVPLKMEHQNLKKEIQRLMHEKEMLLLNKQIKRNIKTQHKFQINKVPFIKFDNTSDLVQKSKQSIAELDQNGWSNSIWYPNNPKKVNSPNQLPKQGSQLTKFVRQSVKSRVSKVIFQVNEKANKSCDFSLSIGKSSSIPAAYSHRTFHTSMTINRSFNNA